jgi:dihydrofolate reductase
MDGRHPHLPADGGDESQGETGVDDDFVARSFEGIGATIMGRNMFGPMRGPWTDDTSTGWWGPNPPYHHLVFILTHHPRDPITMEGGTTFQFVTDGIEVALERAFAAAAGLDVLFRGGVATIQSYLRAGLVDVLHVAISPICSGGGAPPRRIGRRRSPLRVHAARVHSEGHTRRPLSPLTG